MHLVLYTKGHKCTGAQLIFFSNCIFRCRFNYLNLYFGFFTTIDNKFDNLHLYLKLAQGSLCGKRPKCPQKRAQAGDHQSLFYTTTANHGKRTWVSAVKSECIVHYAMCTCAHHFTTTCILNLSENNI